MLPMTTGLLASPVMMQVIRVVVNAAVIPYVKAFAKPCMREASPFKRFITSITD